jgi:hypothetical protein
MSGLLRFQFGGVVAGAVIEDGHVVDAAPVVRKTLGMTLEQVRDQFPAVEWYDDNKFCDDCQTWHEPPVSQRGVDGPGCPAHELGR